MTATANTGFGCTGGCFAGGLFATYGHLAFFDGFLGVDGLPFIILFNHCSMGPGSFCFLLLLVVVVIITDSC